MQKRIRSFRSAASRTKPGRKFYLTLLGAMLLFLWATNLILGSY